MKQQKGSLCFTYLNSTLPTATCRATTAGIDKVALLQRDDASINYTVVGEGPAIILSHGFSYSHSMWDGQLAALSRHYKIICWDMRGHGQSDGGNNLANYSAAATISDMAALLDHCDVKDAVIGGLSLGGYMSLAFQIAHPTRVRALMLFDTGPGFKKDQARDSWNATANARAEEFEANGLATLAGAGSAARDANHASAQGLAHAARGMLAQTDAEIMYSLPDISVPTLVLVGSLDEPFFPATDYMAAKIPNSTKVVIDDAGHAANIDQPAAFNNAVLAFLADL